MCHSNEKRIATYILNTKKSPVIYKTAYVADLQIWYRELGLAINSGILQMTWNRVVIGCQVLRPKNRTKRESHVETKLTRVVISKTTIIHYNISVLEIVHSDVWRPNEHVS